MVRRPRRARRPDTRFPYTALFRSPGDLPAGTIQDRLLDAALACFRRLGGKRSRIEDIASEAGLARTAVYRYYPNKRAIVAALAKDRKSVVSGNGVSVRVDLGGRRIIEKKQQYNQTTIIHNIKHRL